LRRNKNLAKLKFVSSTLSVDLFPSLCGSGLFSEFFPPFGVA
jgi:hypothetical protein